MLSKVLSVGGYEVHLASRGVQAIDKIPQRTYDAFVIDLKMPDFGGESIYRHINEIDPLQADRVVFITGDTIRLERNDFVTSTSNPVIIKPFNIYDLRRHLMSVADGCTGHPDDDKILPARARRL